MVDGGAHLLTALRSDGTVWSCGRNVTGELGVGVAYTQSPVPVQALVTGVEAVSTSDSSVSALKSDHSVWSWGYNSYGQLGNGLWGNGTFDPTPAQVPLSGEFMAVAQGAPHTVALKSDGSVWTWGYNRNGQLGHTGNIGTEVGNPTPIQVPGLTGITAVAAANRASVALKSDGTIWTWGSNDHGELGDGGSATPNHVPRQVSGLSNVTAVDAGYCNVLALRADGSVWSWGCNSFLSAVGMLGDGTTTNRSIPVQVQLADGSPLSGIVRIAAGDHHGLAVRTDGTVVTWGYNNFGQIGDGTTTNRLQAVPVSGLSDVMSVAGGTYHSYALKTDGHVWGWGYNFAGQLCNNESGTTNFRTSPVQALGPGGVGFLNLWAGPTITPSTHDFGSVDVGSTAPAYTFTVTNRSGNPVSLGQAALTGGEQSQFSLTADTCSGESLLTNGTCTLDIAFAPTATGTKSTSLRIPYGDGGTSLLNASLSGIGTDTTGPVLTLPSGGVTAEASSATGAIVNYTVTASDAVDGTITPTCTPPSGSTFSLGTTNVTCTATDQSGHTTSESFVVTVSDTGAPTITVPSTTVTQEASSAAGATVNYTVSASDTVDGAVAANCTPASGTVFPVGSTVVNCSAVDNAGNTGNQSFTVLVHDTTSPSLSLPGPINAVASSASGTVVAYTATASDTVDGALSPTCSPPSGSVFPIGTTAVQCTVRDQAGNTASGSFNVTVATPTPPTVNLLTPVNGASYKQQAVVLANYACAGGGGIVSCAGPVASGGAIDTGTVGQKSFTVNAVGAAGGSASVTHTYQVVYDFGGFYPPVDNPPVVNTVKSGRAIPLKFSLAANQGLNIFAAGYPASQRVQCDTSAPLDAIEETVSAGNSSLTYNSSTGQYHYVWKTESSWSNSCRQLILRFNDGTQYTANFKFQ